MNGTVKAITQSQTTAARKAKEIRFNMRRRVDRFNPFVAKVSAAPAMTGTTTAGFSVKKNVMGGSGNSNAWKALSRIGSAIENATAKMIHSANGTRPAILSGVTFSRTRGVLNGFRPEALVPAVCSVIAQFSPRLLSA